MRNVVHAAMTGALVLGLTGCQGRAPQDPNGGHVETGGKPVDAHQHPGMAPVSDGGAASLAGPTYGGTAAMARRLADMSDGLQPGSGPWDGEQRLQSLLGSPIPVDPQQQFDRAYNIALEQLNSGKFPEAVAAFTELQDTYRGRWSLTDSLPLQQVTSMLAVTWMRWGETQNCAINHNADSCLMPLKGGGIYRDGTTADKAIPLLQLLLRANPNDLTSRWLLNLAHMTRGTWPDAVPEAFRIDPQVFASEDDIGRFVDVAPKLGLDVTGRAGGVIIDDFTGDGNLDVLESTWGTHDPLHFFVSKGDGTFEDRTAAAGLTGLTGGLNMVQADYDGDGWLDFYVLRGAWRTGPSTFPSSLVRNRGDGTFEDVTEAAGMLSFHPTQAGNWADYDGDGDLDLVVGHEDGGPTGHHPNELWRNNGDGTFTDVASASGLNKTPGFAKAAVWGDYDNDGRPDLYFSLLDRDNLLYHNDGPGEDGAWRFSDVTATAGVGKPFRSFPAWWWDYDNDGWLDLMVSGFGVVPGQKQAGRISEVSEVLADYVGLPTNAERLHLYHNNGDGTFENASRKAGVDRVMLTMGCNYGDLDNDGWDDFYLGTGNPDFRTLDPSRMFRSSGDGTFRDITTSGGFGNLQKGHAISFADIDNDGDQDVYADFGGAFEADWYPNALFENPGHPANHWVTLRLRGPGANPSAIGARLAVRVATPRGPRMIHRLVGSGSSFGANSLQVELGLGDATAIEHVSVTWPGGSAESFTGLGLDAIWQLRAGSGAATSVAQAAFTLGGGSVARSGQP